MTIRKQSRLESFAEFMTGFTWLVSVFWIATHVTVVYQFHPAAAIMIVLCTAIVVTALVAELFIYIRKKAYLIGTFVKYQ